MSEEAVQDTGSEGGASEAVAQAAAESHFLDGINEAYRNNPNLTKHPTLDSLAQSHVHLQSMIGADKLPKPQANWSDEQYLEFYASAGRPEDASKYELSDIENNAEIWQKYKQAAFDAGLNPRQAQSMVNFLNQSHAEQQEVHSANVDAMRNETKQQLLQEFGSNAEAIVKKADHVATKYLGEDFVENLELADGRVLGDVPEIIRMCAAIARDIGEDTIEGQTSETLMTSEESLRRANELMMSDAYTKKLHPEHDWTVKEVEKYFQQAYSG